MCLVSLSQQVEEWESEGGQRCHFGEVRVPGDGQGCHLDVD